AVADRDLDAEVALVGEVAAPLQPIGLPHLDGRSAVAELGPVAHLELLVEVFRRRCPDQVVLDLVDSAQRALRGDPLDLRCETRVDLPPVAGLRSFLECGREAPGNRELVVFHPHLPVTIVPSRSSSTSSATSSPSGRWVISRTDVSPAAAKTSLISASAAGGSRWAVGSSSTSSCGPASSARATQRR